MNKIILGIILVGIAGLAFFLGTGRAEGQINTAHTGKWWYTNAPHIVGVNPYTGELKAVWKGTATVCSQPSITVRRPAQCFTVTVSQVVK